MRFVASCALGLIACSETMPPPIGDSDSSLPQYFADAYPTPTIEDSGADAGLTESLDFAGTCANSGEVPIWHFFDFQTHTPGNSSLQFAARSAVTEEALATAPSVHLATVTGADITTFTGIDVDTQLKTIGQQSNAFLRVVIVATNASDGTPPALVHYRQEYDCVVGQ